VRSAVSRQSDISNAKSQAVDTSTASIAQMREFSWRKKSKKTGSGVGCRDVGYLAWEIS